LDDNVYIDIMRRILIMESMICDIYDSVCQEKVCPLCEEKIRLYVPFGKPLRRSAQCPVCRSLERHRAFWIWINSNIDLSCEGFKVLHFAPEKCLLDKFSRMSNIDYYAVDINPDKQGIRDVIDIQNINYSDGTFDLIVCNHVLEHIPDDKAALLELRRVLKVSGILLLTVPINLNRDKTFENPEYNTPELRLKNYGHKDHRRMYGIIDLERSVQRAGLTAERIMPNKHLTSDELNCFGLKKEEILFKCTK